YVSTIITGVGVASATNFLTPSQALELTNIGTLFAFFLVSGGVIALRYIAPDRPRLFKVPLYPVTPILSMLSCVGLMLGLPASHWWRLALRPGVGLRNSFS